jgi:endonuclease/exonuclease/phosphatase family metal-dependent hydrolase
VPRSVSSALLVIWLAAAGLLADLRPAGNAEQADVRSAQTSGAPVRWLRVGADNEVPALNRWNAGVGPPFVMAQPAVSAPAQVPVVVSWNTHVGAGDVDTLVADLRSGKLTGKPVSSFLLLLQEVYRSGKDVPSKEAGRAAWAKLIKPSRLAGPREDIAAIAQRLKLNAFYVPSMRNGAPLITDEDRGNAIMSTLPLSELTAIELPLESQRRVALQATITLAPPGRAAVPLRVVCTHFTNMVLHHLFVLSESGRLRQARALRRVLPAEGPLIVGGDFNSWFGYRDAAFKELAAVAPPAATDDRRATFGPMRLDHVLLRLPEGWRASVRRLDSKYGSDHYPLIAVVETR